MSKVWILVAVCGIGIAAVLVFVFMGGGQPSPTMPTATPREATAPQPPAQSSPPATVNSTPVETEAEAEYFEKLAFASDLLYETKQRADETLDICTHAILYGDVVRQQNGFDLLYHDFDIYAEVINALKDGWKSMDYPATCSSSWSCLFLGLVHQTSAYNTLSTSGFLRDVDMFRQGLAAYDEAHAEIAECLETDLSQISSS